MKQAVCILIINKVPNFFLSVSLKDDYEDMNLPGGKVEENETLIEAAIRETKEETGLDIKNLQFLYEEPDEKFNVVTYYTYDYGGDIHTNENHIVKWLPLIYLQNSKKWQDYNTKIYKLYLQNY